MTKCYALLSGCRNRKILLCFAILSAFMLCIPFFVELRRTEYTKLNARQLYTPSASIYVSHVFQPKTGTVDYSSQVKTARIKDTSSFKASTSHTPSRNVTVSHVLPTKNTAFRELKDYLTFPGREQIKLNCSTCAYVAGSGHMLGSKKGSEIDSMDCVFRSNEAPTIGFEEDVGTKTTVRIVGIISLHTILNTYETCKKLSHPDVPARCAGPDGIVAALFYSPAVEKEYEKFHNRHPSWNLSLSTRKRWSNTLENFKKRVSAAYDIWISNGYTGIYAAHDVCDVTHVYGINDENFCKHIYAKEPGYKDVPYHYYGGGLKGKNCDTIRGLDRRKSSTHKFTLEKTHYRQLIKEWGNLYFHSPEWEIFSPIRDLQ